MLHLLFQMQHELPPCDYTKRYGMYHQRLSICTHLSYHIPLIWKPLSVAIQLSILSQACVTVPSSLSKTFPFSSVALICNGGYLEKKSATIPALIQNIVPPTKS